MRGARTESGRGSGRGRLVTVRVWLGVVAIVLTALAPLAGSPISGDDVPNLMASIASFESLGFWATLTQNIAGSVSGAHVHPVGAVAATIHAWVAHQIGLKTGLSAADAWSAMRPLWILVALSAAWSLTGVGIRRSAPTGCPNSRADFVRPLQRLSHSDLPGPGILAIRTREVL